MAQGRDRDHAAKQAEQASLPPGIEHCLGGAEIIEARGDGQRHDEQEGIEPTPVGTGGHDQRLAGRHPLETVEVKREPEQLGADQPQQPPSDAGLQHAQARGPDERERRRRGGDRDRR
ncbi:MAG: hypothetical protein H0V24_13000 [Chloroflexia bacterium]|nr:hypothetical protein [Chloroflexia bacterium]